MPPKAKYKREEIVDVAFDYVRQHGWTDLSARNLAVLLDSTTGLVYAHFKSMKELAEEVVRKSLDLIYEYMIQVRTGDPWVDQGVGYLLFAKNEKYLFRMMYEEEHAPLRQKHDDRVWKKMGRDLSDYPGFKGLPEEITDRIRRGRMLMVHGMSCLVNVRTTRIGADEELINFVKNSSQVVYDGILSNRGTSLTRKP